LLEDIVKLKVWTDTYFPIAKLVGASGEAFLLAIW